MSQWDCNQWRKELNRTNVKLISSGRVGREISSEIKVKKVKRPTRNVVLWVILLLDITVELQQKWYTEYPARFLYNNAQFLSHLF